MNLLDLTTEQLRRAASIKEQIDDLNKELAEILGSTASGAVVRNHRTMSASAKRKIAAAQKARWATIRRARTAVTSVKTTATKKSMSPAARAKLSAKLKAYWKSKKSGKN